MKAGGRIYVYIHTHIFIFLAIMDDLIVMAKPHVIKYQNKV